MPGPAMGLTDGTGIKTSLPSVGAEGRQVSAGWGKGKGKGKGGPRGF